MQHVVGEPVWPGQAWCTEELAWLGFVASRFELLDLY
jgi:hypothetical protein